MRNINFRKNYLSSPILHLSSAKGFTLIELLVVFSLIAILSGIGFASFVSYSRKQTVAQAAANLKQEIDLARFNSLSFVKPSDCVPEDSIQWYKFNLCKKTSCKDVNTDTIYEINASCANSSIKPQKFPANVSIDTANTTCTQLTFNTLSQKAEGVPCEIKVQGYENTVTLSVDSQGYVTQSN